jgi:hypothetical protein
VDRMEKLGQIVSRERNLMSPSVVMPRACGASSTPQLLGSSTTASGIRDRPVKPGDDSGERRRNAKPSW